MVTKQEALQELARRELARRRGGSSTAMDVALSAQSGLADATADILGTPSIPKAAADAAGGLSAIGRSIMPDAMGPLFDVQDKVFGAIKSVTDYIPDAEDIRGLLPSHEPQTRAGEIAQTAGQYAPNALAPGGLLRRGAMVAAPTIGNELAGMLTEGTDLEGPARAAGGLVGGLTAAGMKRETLRTIKQAAKTATLKTGEEMKREIRTAYDQMRQAGFTYDPDAFASTLHRTKQALVSKGYHPSVAGQAHGLIDDLAKNPALDFGALDAQSSAIGKQIRGLYRAGNDAAAAALEVLKDNLDDFAVNPKLAPGHGLTAKELAAMRADARALVLRAKKAEAVETMIATAEDSTSGFVTALNGAISRELKKGKNSIFNEGEKNLLRSVMAGKEHWQKIPAVVGLVPGAGPLAGGTMIRAADIAKVGKEGAIKSQIGKVATAMRNENLEAVAREARREQNRQALRQLMGIRTGLGSISE